MSINLEEFARIDSMTPEIVQKLCAEIRDGFNKESQVVYLLAGVRKILEQEASTSDEYFYLKFHCDWTLHAKLDRASAQRILAHFNSAHFQLLKGENLTSNSEAEKISKMHQFREELSKFLRAHAIDEFSKCTDTWAKFIYLYARVIKDVPLVIRGNTLSEVKEITVSVEMAEHTFANQRFFKVCWNVTDKNRKSGTIFVLNSFEEPK